MSSSRYLKAESSLEQLFNDNKDHEEIYVNLLEMIQYQHCKYNLLKFEESFEEISHSRKDMYHFNSEKMENNFIAEPLVTSERFSVQDKKAGIDFLRPFDRLEDISLKKVNSESETVNKKKVYNLFEEEETNINDELKLSKY